ncbi:M14-type cytosolic carboxypeptidase [uncultured Pseudoteredinibacter sp.]|uniref:M14 family metallopeptidase n=1 Tax=uncultured Pseudoteredinibacter sp. TaxID=1641701 RepID=UPI002620C7AC|nr:M14-type cytosolic carboxypeptidase [uncultured Pseudoteredinibacter sp.]
MSTTVSIASDFDGGNIVVKDATNPEQISLEIRRDIAADYFQWFYFSVSNCANQTMGFSLDNASKASYADAWENYNVVASYDRENWFRVPAQYQDGQLKWQHQSEQGKVYYSYFAPYDKARHQQLLTTINSHKRCEQIDQCQTVDGHSVELFKFASSAENTTKRNLWLIARQHPGETMAEWFMEGLLEKLFAMPDSEALLMGADIYFVVNMNPDGSWAGNLRTNGAGTDLNRAWQDPSAEASPEVLMVRNAMDRIGVDMFLDIHGDEELPYVFTAGCEGNPAYSLRLQELEERFRRRYQEINPDFQSVYGYDKDEPGKADLRIACNQVGQRFDCLSFTIEMPFKDNANIPDEKEGWSPERSRVLGVSTLELMAELLPDLR